MEKGKKAIVRRDWKLLGGLFNQNQTLLSKLGVSTDKLDKMCLSALTAGAYGAKLSGAGGGDCMIALVNSKYKKKVEKAMEEVGGKIINVESADEGVRVED